MLLKFRLYPECGDCVYINPLHVGSVGVTEISGTTCIYVIGDDTPYKVQGTVDDVAMRINDALEDM